MPTCNECSLAIAALRPQLQPKTFQKVNVVLPQFQPTTPFECWVCAKFSDCLKTERPSLFDEWRRGPLSVVFSWYARVDLRPPGFKRMFWYNVNIGFPEDDSDYDLCEIVLHLISTEDFTPNPIRPLNGHRTIYSDLTVARSWIEKCTKSHKNCASGDDSWYPTRLLYIHNQNPKVRLVHSKDHLPKGPYITLSHRWESNMPIKLEYSTIAQLQNEVIISSLPQVFQNTIEIARYFGICYLWIDVLCIKQDKDDLSDWDIESQNMGKVYSNAFLNVAATLSSDGTESLFQDRPSDPIRPSKLSLDIDGTPHNYYIMDGNIWRDEIDNAPLNSRGWVFQERFLARRILHFGPRQLGWECRELEALEIFPNGLPRGFTTTFMSKPRVYGMMSKLSQGSNEDFASEWHVLVNNYSKCSLTFTKDKLVAFSGICESIMASRADHYVAGVWSKTLAYDLAWMRYDDEQEKFPISETSFRAPSWSWACVDGEVHFPTFLENAHHFVNNLEIIPPTANGSSAPPNLPLIKFKGIRLPLKIRWSSTGISYFKIEGFRFPEKSDDMTEAAIDCDGAEQELQTLVEKGRVSFLPLFVTRSLRGIVLGKVRGVRTYRRLGAVQIPMRKAFDKMDLAANMSERHSQSRKTAQHLTFGVQDVPQSVESHARLPWHKTALGLFCHIAQQQYLDTTLC